jgi:hypothetical protein
VSKVPGAPDPDIVAGYQAVDGKPMVRIDVREWGWDTYQDREYHITKEAAETLLYKLKGAIKRCK